MMHKWPIRDSRPVKENLSGKQAMLTCQRVIDALFPVTLGGTAAVPGEFLLFLWNSVASWSCSIS